MLPLEVNKGPYKLELVGPLREHWLTNLDFLCCKLTIDPQTLKTSCPPTKVTIHFQGAIVINKNLFGPNDKGIVGYHLARQRWNFLSKSEYRYVLRLQETHILDAAFRINARLPIAACPLQESTHVTLPPTTPFDQSPEELKSRDHKPGAYTIYEMIAEIDPDNGTKEELRLEFPFVPCETLENGSLSDIRDVPGPGKHLNLKRITVLRDFLRATGELHTSIDVPRKAVIDEDLKSFTLPIMVTLMWVGDLAHRPELVKIIPQLRLLQALDQTHMTDNRKHPIVNLGFTKGPHHQIKSTRWTQLSPKTARAEIACIVQMRSESSIVPSFTSCLFTSTYEMRLELSLRCPGSLRISHQSVTIEYPIILCIETPDPLKPDNVFMDSWVSQNIDGLDLNGMSATEYFTASERKPRYIESLTQFAVPAPMPSVPSYSEPLIDQAEIERIPAWQLKDATSTP